MPERYRDPFSDRKGLAARMHEAWDAESRAWEAESDALAIVAQFNARLSANRPVWFWPKITAALTAKHPWVSILCDSCGGVTDLDLRMKPRDPEASIRVVLRDVRCPRCNGHGRPRIIGLASTPV